MTRVSSRLPAIDCVACESETRRTRPTRAARPRAPGRVNPELEPTDDEIEAELNTMLGAPAAAAALADVKQEA